MWPLLAVSLVALTVVLERLWFTLREKVRRQPDAVGEIFAAVERGDLAGARAKLAQLDRICSFGCYEAEELRRWIESGRGSS